MSIKKVTKSAPVKKAVKKGVRKTDKKTVKKSLVYADTQNSFWVSNGQILNSLIALRDALSAMEREVYSYHVTKDRNDFANWVEAVLTDSQCAVDLKKAKTPNSAKTIVLRHLKTYSI